MSKEIKDMDFKELRNEVQMLKDALAIMQRKYEDILYNLDNENFSERIIKEKNGMKTQIEINEEGIKTKVSNEDFESEMKQTASLIATKVSNEDFESTIAQTYENISMEVSKVISTKFVSNVTPTRNNTTDEQKNALCEYNGILYYWNDVSGMWKKAPYADGVKSQFLQTEDGFELTGDVSISGDLIAGGTISGSKLQGGIIVGESGNYKLILRDSSDATTGNFALYNQYYPYNPEQNLDVPYFSIYDDTMGGIGIRVAKKLLLGAEVSGSDVTVTPYGTWDFSHSGVNVIGIGGGEATFG